MSKPLVIFGNREIASLAQYYFNEDSDYRVEAFCVDDEYIAEDTFSGLPVIPFSEVSRRCPVSEYDMHVALSYQQINRLRHAKYEQAKAVGYRLASYICSKSAVWPDLSIGDNCLILENQTIQPTVRIGNDVMIWSGNHIGHGTQLGDHLYLASHICISGHCVLGERCFVGVNATFKDFTTVGDEAFITMDASVTRDVPGGAVVLGTPATILSAEDEKAVKIRNNYFGLD